MKTSKTQRGFALVEFTDCYNESCSLQESSLATEACVWLGIDDVKLLEEGWLPEFPMRVRPLPPERAKGIRVHGRMHLNQEMAAELIPLLQHFVDTGRLPG
jgi:hypothetical protein